MELTIWLSFVGTVLILAFTPGPSVLLATANSMKYGPVKTLGTILGDLSANLLQIILASAGLASIVIASGDLFQAIKWLGVTYLIYTGVMKMLKQPAIKFSGEGLKERGFWKLYAEGFLMSAANPKAIVFFAALFPLFIDQSLPIIAQISILTITFLSIDGLSLVIYVQFANRLKGYLENSRKVHLQNKIVGLLLILSGLLLSRVQRVNG